MDYSNFDFNQLVIGTKTELEHTNDLKTAFKICTDHLAEIPDYYTRLLKMEQEAKNETKTEDNNMGNSSDLITTKIKKEELILEKKYVKLLTDNNIDFDKIGEELIVDDNYKKQLDGLDIKYIVM